MEWIDEDDRIVHPRLKHGQIYSVILKSGQEIKALFNVYAGGEEVAWLLPITRGELSVIKFRA